MTGGMHRTAFSVVMGCSVLLAIFRLLFTFPKLYSGAYFMRVTKEIEEVFMKSLFYIRSAFPLGIVMSTSGVMVVNLLLSSHIVGEVRTLSFVRKVRAAKLVLTLALVFLLLEMPALMTALLKTLLNNAYVIMICNILLVLDSVCNFLIFFCTSADFRQQLTLCKNSFLKTH